MALTNEILKANAALAGLSDEQLNAIAELSRNDELSVLPTAQKALREQFAAKVAELSGQDRNAGEDVFKFTQRAFAGLSEQAGKAGELADKLKGYETKVAELENTIKDGKGNEVLNQRLKDYENTVAQLQTALVQETEAKAATAKEYESKLLNFRSSAEFDKALAGLKFKPEYPEHVAKILVNSAKADILNGHTPDFTEAGQMVFRDQNGVILTNKANGLNPYTAAELLKERLADVLDAGVKQTGAGTTGGNVKQGLAAIAGAKTQTEAFRAIGEQLMAEGLTKGTPQFAEKELTLAKESGVMDLPLR